MVNNGCRLLPESVIWLYANNRVAEADQIIRNAAKLNNITMPDKILIQPVAMEITVSDNENADDDACKKKDGKLLDKFYNNREDSRSSETTKDRSTRYTVLDIFRNRRLTTNMLCMVLLWWVMSLIDFYAYLIMFVYYEPFVHIIQSALSKFCKKYLSQEIILLFDFYRRNDLLVHMLKTHFWTSEYKERPQQLNFRF